MKVLCVCGLGQGTSLILRMNVETVLREMNVQAEVDHMDLSSAMGSSADYIVTSKELAESLGETTAEVVVVNNFFDNAEIKAAFEKHIK